jgi:hypothetical protein
MVNACATAHISQFPFSLCESLPLVDEIVYGYGTGVTKVSAKEAAARQALEALQSVNAIPKVSRENTLFRDQAPMTRRVGDQAGDSIAAPAFHPSAQSNLDHDGNPGVTEGQGECNPFFVFFFVYNLPLGYFEDGYKTGHTRGSAKEEAVHQAAQRLPSNTNANPGTNAQPELFGDQPTMTHRGADRERG